ncbi:MAG: hypothetical protein RL364_805 [Pseudomonadota bacterium]|jgi:uncharacterized protein (TIGR02001 family)
MKASASKSLVLAALIAAPLMASAQLSSNVSLVSNYKFRGQDQDTSKTTAVKPALQGGFDYAFSNGFYVGNWNSSVNWVDDNDSIEMDVYGGYKGDFSGVGYDVGLLKYAYPGSASANTTEAYLGLTYGAFTAKYSTTVSDHYFTSGTKAAYFNVSYAQEISKGLTLKAAVGQTNFKDNGTYPDYFDYLVGASYDLGDGYSMTGAVVGGNKGASFVTDGVDVNKNRFILTFTKAM